MSHVCPMPRTTHPETKRGELGTKPVSLQARISLTFTSTKCWLDFQLLNIGIRTGVIVFYKLSSSYILCIGLFVYFPNFPDNFRNGSEVSLLLHVLFVLYFICNSE